MKIKASQNGSYCLLEILADNGQPASPQNPIHHSEYANVDFPDVSGKLVVISGMPMSAVAKVVAYYKNMFSAMAIANPRNGVAEIIHTITSDHPDGSVIPLA